MLVYLIRMKSTQAILRLVSHNVHHVVRSGRRIPQIHYRTLALVKAPFSWQGQDVTASDPSISTQFVSIRSNHAHSYSAIEREAIRRNTSV